MSNPARAVPGGGMIPSGSSVDGLRAFVQSADFQALPTAVQQQILDKLGPAANGLIPSTGGGMIPPPPREPPVIRIPGGDPDVPPGGRLPPPDAPARLPGPEPDAPAKKGRFPWENVAAALGLGGLAALVPSAIDYFDGDDPNLEGASTPLNVEPAVGKPLGADALGAKNAPGAGIISPSHRARVNYWAERTGTPVATVAGMFASNPNKALVDLNMMASQQYQDRNKAARDRWQATAMLAGGSQNINSGNRGAYNILNELKGEDRDRALLYMTPAGPLAAGVDARSADRASEMAQRAMEGMLANQLPMSEEKRRALETMTQQRDAEQAAEVLTEAQSLINARADQPGWTNLAGRKLFGGVEGWDNTLLTIEEEEQTIRLLRAKYPHLSYEQALEVVNAAARGATRQTRPALPAGR